MDAGNVIALIFGVLGFVAGTLGFLAARRANGIAAGATNDARMAGQEPYRRQAREQMEKVREVIPEAIENSEGASSTRDSSSREVLWGAAEPFKDLAQCLGNQSERAALERLADQWRTLASRTADVDRARQRYSDALAPWAEDRLPRRTVELEETISLWEEAAKAVDVADKRAKDALAAGSRLERPARAEGVLARFLEG